MEIRTLRYFLAVAREENMTRAAEQLHLTQPTLSKALKALEEELGKKLFTRHSFSIRLTDEGVLLRNRAEDLVSMADKITQEFVTLDDITGGDIYLGLAESYQIRTLARAIKEFRGQYPDLRYHITSGDTEQVTEKLDQGLLDFSVLAEMPDAGYKFGRWLSVVWYRKDLRDAASPGPAPLRFCQGTRLSLFPEARYPGRPAARPDLPPGEGAQKRRGDPGRGGAGGRLPRRHDRQHTAGAL